MKKIGIELDGVPVTAVLYEDLAHLSDASTTRD